ncbi:MAG: divergent polysaccharide deacetylase family protein [Alphaproteobacteria bacterium]
MQTTLDKNTSGSFVLENSPEKITPPIATTLTTAWLGQARPYEASHTKPLIALVIDDLGVDHTRTHQVMDLPVPLTLAFLPYASDIVAQVDYGRRLEHEFLVHIPMEPIDHHNDPGPHTLSTDLPPEEIVHRLDSALNSFEGYLGINNHMGSRFTMDATALAPVMATLQQRGLLFLDSRTTAQSIAAQTAIDAGVAAVARDVFIDHVRTPDVIRAQLALLEQTALRKGTAIGIGHPDDLTIAALQEWIPTLAERGFELVPLSVVARVRLWDRDRTKFARHP